MMKRLTTDTPDGNLENALNLFFVRNGEAWVRGGGPYPDFPDITLDEYIREAVKMLLGSALEELSDEDLHDVMAEWLFDGHESCNGLISTLYTAAWAFAEIRERLKLYEDMEARGCLIVLPCDAGKEG